MGSKVKQIVGAALLLTASFFTGGLALGLGAAGLGFQMLGARSEAKKQQRAAERQAARVRSQTDVVQGGVQPRMAVYGESIVGGVIADQNAVRNTASGVDSYWRVIVLAHCYDPYPSKSNLVTTALSGFYLNDDYLPWNSTYWDQVDGSQLTTRAGGNGAPKGTFRPKNWGKRFSTGTPGVADAAIRVRWSKGDRVGGPPISEQKLDEWTSADEGAKIFWSEWQFIYRGGTDASQNTNDLFEGGPPKIRAVAKYMRCFDPRKLGYTGRNAKNYFMQSATQPDTPANANFSQPTASWRLTVAAARSNNVGEATDPVWCLTTYKIGNKWYRMRPFAIKNDAAYTLEQAKIHVLENEDTWEWTDNPLWAMIHYMYVFSGRNWNHKTDGFGEHIWWNTAMQAADICDEIVSVPGGTEKRWRCDVAVILAAGANVNRRNEAAIRSSCGMEVVEHDGRLAFSVPMARPATGETVFQVTRSMLTGPVSGSSNDPVANRFNKVQMPFLSRHHNWKHISSPERSNDASVAKEGVLLQAFESHSITRNTQAQRFLQLQLNLQNTANETINLGLKWMCLRLIHDAVFDLEGAPGLWDGFKRFRVEYMSLNSSRDVPIAAVVREDESDVYDDLPVSSYHTLSPLGVVSTGEADPFPPTSLSAGGISGGINLRWTNPEFYDEAVLYASATENWDDAVKIWAGKADAYAHIVNVERWYWVRVMLKGRESTREPDDDVSDVNATPLTVATGPSGAAYRETDAYKSVVKGAAVPNRPTFTWAGTTANPFSGLVASEGFSLEYPSVDLTENDVYLSTATLISTDADKSVPGSTPVLHSGGFDLEIIYILSKDKPPTPADSALTPTGWSSDPLIPTPGLFLWESLGLKKPGSSAFDWKEPVRVSGAEGPPGVSYLEKVAYKSVVKGVSVTAPTFSWVGPSNDPFNGLSYTDGWEETQPAAGFNYVVYGTIETISSTDTDRTVVARTPVGLTNSSGSTVAEISRVYIWSQQRPFTPVSSASAVPTTWSISIPEPPESGGTLWTTFGIKTGNGNYIWEAPVGLPADSSYRKISLYWTLPAPYSRRLVAPTITWVGPTTYLFYGLKVSDDFVFNPPAIDGTKNDIYVTTASLPSNDADKMVVGSTPVLWSWGFDVDIVYRRSATTPTTPSDSSGVPTDWFADPPTGTDLLWESFGVKGPGSANFVWGKPAQISGERGRDGRAGTDGTDGSPGTAGREGLPARESRFRYGSIVTNNNAFDSANHGRYRFYTGASLPRAPFRHPTLVTKYNQLPIANRLDMSKTDLAGYPNLVLDDLVAGQDYVIYFINSYTWVVYSVIFTGALTGGRSLFITHASSSRTFNAALIPTGNVSFFFSRPRRPKPSYAKSYRYDFQRNILANPGGNGRYAFHTGTTPTLANIIGLGSGKFVELVRDAKTLVVSLHDDGGNGALAWDELRPNENHTVIYERPDARHWVAWVITSRDDTYSTDVEFPYTTFGLRLLSYDTTGNNSLPTTQGTIDIQFRLSEFAFDVDNYLAVDFPLEESYIGEFTVTAELVGNAIDKADWTWFYSGTSVTSFVWDATNSGRTSSVRITLGGDPTEEKILLGVFARIPRNGAYATQRKIFTYGAVEETPPPLDGILEAEITTVVLAVGGSTVMPTVSVTGTQIGDITYVWRTSAGTLTNETTAAPTLVMPPSGSVTLEVDVTRGGKTVTDVHVITVPRLFAVIQGPDTGTPNAKITLVSELVVFWPTGAYTYVWSTDNGTLSSTSTSSTILTLPATGQAEVSLSVTQNGVVSTDTHVVSVYVAPDPGDPDPPVPPPRFSIRMTSDKRIVVVDPTKTGTTFPVTFTALFSNPGTLPEIQFQRFGVGQNTWITHKTQTNATSPFSYEHPFPSQSNPIVTRWRVAYRRTEGAGLSASEEIEVSVRRRVTSLSLSVEITGPTTATIGVAFVVRALVSGSASGSIRFVWAVQGGTYEGQSGQISVTLTSMDATITVTVLREGKVATDSHSVTADAATSVVVTADMNSINRNPGSTASVVLTATFSSPSILAALQLQHQAPGGSFANIGSVSRRRSSPVSLTYVFAADADTGSHRFRVSYSVNAGDSYRESPSVSVTLREVPLLDVILAANRTRINVYKSSQLVNFTTTYRNPSTLSTIQMERNADGSWVPITGTSRTNQASPFSYTRLFYSTSAVGVERYRAKYRVRAGDEFGNTEVVPITIVKERPEDLSVSVVVAPNSGDITSNALGVAVTARWASGNVEEMQLQVGLPANPASFALTGSPASRPSSPYTANYSIPQGTAGTYAFRFRYRQREGKATDYYFTRSSNAVVTVDARVPTASVSNTRIRSHLTVNLHANWGAGSLPFVQAQWSRPGSSTFADIGVSETNVMSPRTRTFTPRAILGSVTWPLGVYQFRWAYRLTAGGALAHSNTVSVTVVS